MSMRINSSSTYRQSPRFTAKTPDNLEKAAKIEVIIRNPALGSDFKVEGPLSKVSKFMGQLSQFIANSKK